jgi:hypothetical protein
MNSFASAVPCVAANVGSIKGLYLSYQNNNQLPNGTIVSRRNNLVNLTESYNTALDRKSRSLDSLREEIFDHLDCLTLQKACLGYLSNGTDEIIAIRAEANETITDSFHDLNPILATVEALKRKLESLIVTYTTFADDFYDSIPEIMYAA